MLAVIIVVACLASASAQMPSQCQSNCVNQHARNTNLYTQMFQGSISQNDYNSVCNDINSVQSCLQQCQGQTGTSNNGNMQTNGQQQSNTFGSSGSDCLTVSLPIYTTACSAGYQQFSQLGQCYQRLNSGYSAAKQQCQQQCASTSNNGRRRRRQAMNDPLVNSNTFCLTNCGLSQQLSTIQSQCNSWVAQFAQTVSQTYNQLYQLSPSCLRM